MKTYFFEIPCTYAYGIRASNEEEARAILEEKGGIDIDDIACKIDCRDYRKAKVIQINKD